MFSLLRETKENLQALAYEGYTRVDGQHFDGKQRVPNKFVTIKDTTGQQFNIKTTFDVNTLTSEEEMVAAYEANYSS